MLIKKGLLSEPQTRKLKHYLSSCSHKQHCRCLLCHREQTSFCSSSSTLDVPCVVSHSAFVPSSFACLVFYFFLKYAFSRDTTSFTDRLSCVLWQICCRASWSQLCLALVFSCCPLPKPHWTRPKHFYIYTVTQFLI